MSREILISIYSGAAALIILGGINGWPRLSKPLRIVWGVLVAGIALLALRRIELVVAANLADPPPYDIGAFWLFGRVALLTGRIYDPAAFHAIGQGLNYGPAWSHERLDVGFPNPPPAILIFAPLGFFGSVRASEPFWYALVFAALVACIGILWSAYLRNYRWAGLLAAAGIVLAFQPTYTTIQHGQTMFFQLLFLLLAATNASNLRTGVWLALTCTVKPFAWPLIVYPVVRRRWSMLASAAGTGGILFGAAIALLGWRNVATYFTSGPYTRYPASAISEIYNQSILGAMLRARHQSMTYADSLRDPLYLLVFFAFVIASAWLCVRAPRRERDLCLSLLISTALVIFPHVIYFFVELLIVPLLVLWKRRAEFRGGTVLVPAFAVIEYALAGPVPTGLLASLYAWALVAWVMLDVGAPAATTSAPAVLSCADG